MTDLEDELSARRLGRTVGGKWLLERVLGIGGMATVYAARDASGAVAAIKILHPEMSVRREVRDRFLREGYVANSIGHAGVVRALEHGDMGEEVFLAMELLAGETLRARVKRHGRLPVEEVLDYADQVLDVLCVAHEKGVIHRDLKPDNLFVSAEGRIKILDFGLARVLEGVPAEHRTRTGVALGTLAYMAPEQALGRRAEIDGRVDVFALGATMFRILTGRRVHEAESEAELLMAMASRPAPPLASVLPGISPAVSGVVDLALAFSREARYPDARTMQGDVRALRQGQPGPYASVRISSREDATRVEMAPTTSQRTQPLSATHGSHVPGTSSTMPMPVASMGVMAVSPGFGEPVSARQPPSSGHTAPFSGHPPPIAVAVPAQASGPASFATTLPSTQAPAFITSQPVRTPTSAVSRGTLVAFLLVGFGALAVGGATAAWYFLSGEADGAAAPGASAAPTAPAVPVASVGAPSDSPAATIAENVEAPNAPARKAPGKKQDAVSTPSASSAPAPSPSAALGPSAAAPVAPAPSPSGAAVPSPTSPAPPSPSAAPAPAPASPTVAPPPAPTDGRSSKRGRGKNR